jgi:ribonuclease Z
MAYGISIEHQQGWKLVYSGDTRPCDNDMIKEAIEKRHSTTAEAVEIGKR